MAATLRAHLRLLGRLAASVVLATGALVAQSTLAAPAPTAPAGNDCDTSDVLRDRSRVDALESSAQQDFLGRLNSLRRAKNLGSLAWNEAVTGYSIDWSETMSRQIPPGGSASDPGWLHHARDTGPDDGVAPEQDYVTINSRIIPNWRRMGENVGVGGMRQSCSWSDLETNTDRVVQALHDAFVKSPGHYKNMVGDFNQVGIGVHIDDNELWVTVRFALGDLPRNTSTTVTPEVAAYVDAVYGVFMGRRASDGEEQRWAPAVHGGDRLSLTRSVAVSDYFTGARVNDLYRVVLGRSADAGGRAYWVDQVARGLQIESAAVEFFGSAEYFHRNGGTDAAFVRALYDDLLGRRADSAGVAYWVGFLRRGELTRSGVADNFYRSIESRRDRAGRLYAEILRSTPSASTRDAWAERLASIGDVNLAAELAATTTFYNQAVK